MNPIQFYHAEEEDLISSDSAADGPQAPYGQDIATWKTCLRKIIFLDTNIDLENGERFPAFELKKDQAALEFLLQVLCGLKSKIFGETEVFGQFKKFIDSPEAKKISFLSHTTFIQFIFQQVKELRETFITDLGAQSYGSLIRKKYIKHDEISLVGYGHLAHEIIPWLETKKINVHVRNSYRYTSTAEFEFHELGLAKLNPVVIIAAPIPSEQLQKLLSHQAIQQIIDCRALYEHQKNSLKSRVRALEIIELKDLFKMIESSKSKAELIRPVIEKDISARITRYLLRSQHRPKGWEDLCG